jgi:hypothetical protein
MWSLILREEHMWKVCETAVLRKIFGPKRNKVTGDWRRVHNEELHDLYTSSTVIQAVKLRGMRWVGHVSCMGKKRDAYSVLEEQPEEKTPLGRPRHTWEDNIKMDFKETVWEGMDWIDVTHDIHKWQDVVDVVMNIWVP